MQRRQPAPEQELNTGPEVTVARAAATVILLRGGSCDLEVLLVRRNPEARFMGGAWVFPGGAVNRGEGEGQHALRTAALRELQEEAGIRIDRLDALTPFSRWITPAQAKIRFDTWFYLAPAPPGVAPQIDGGEIVDARWYRPAAALEDYDRGKLTLVFPTIKHLEQISGFESATALIEYAVGLEVRPVQPRVVRHGETARIVLPGDEGYDE